MSRTVSFAYWFALVSNRVSSACPPPRRGACPRRRRRPAPASRGRPRSIGRFSRPRRLLQRVDRPDDVARHAGRRKHTQTRECYSLRRRHLLQNLLLSKNLGNPVRREGAIEVVAARHARGAQWWRRKERGFRSQLLLGPPGPLLRLIVGRLGAKPVSSSSESKDERFAGVESSAKHAKRLLIRKNETLLSLVTRFELAVS